jgi:hypothetical protein
MPDSAQVHVDRPVEEVAAWLDARFGIARQVIQRARDVDPRFGQASATVERQYDGSVQVRVAGSSMYSAVLTARKADAGASLTMTETWRLPLILRFVPGLWRHRTTPGEKLAMLKREIEAMPPRAPLPHDNLIDR